MAKTLFNFYCDDELKAAVIAKLNRLNGEMSKGQMAALIRVQLKLFRDTPDDQVSKSLLRAVQAEYEATAIAGRNSHKL